MQPFLDSLQEGAAGFRPGNVACGMPALVPRERVAQRVQRGEQGQIGPLLIAPAEPRHERADPLLGCLYRSVERLNACHRCLLGVRTERHKQLKISRMIWSVSQAHDGQHCVLTIRALLVADQCLSERDSPSGSEATSRARPAGASETARRSKQIAQVTTFDLDPLRKARKAPGNLRRHLEAHKYPVQLRAGLLFLCLA